MSEAPEVGFFTASAGETPDEIDARWRRTVYAGDQPQLTLRATITGMILGALLALSNLYVGLKTGWSFSVAITACVLSFSFWRGLSGTRLASRPLSLLETNCMQSTASAAGYTVVSVMVSAVPAYLMITGVTIRPVWLVLWGFFVGALGLMLFIPLKRQLINYEQLKFPSGMAAAATLKGLFARGADALDQARALYWGMLAGSLGYWLTVNNAFQWWPVPRIPETLSLPGRIGAVGLSSYTVGVDLTGVNIAAGALMGLRICLWMLTGAVLNYLVLAPWLVSRGWLPQPVHYGSIQTGFSLWLGSALMIGASLTDLFLDRRSVARALGGLGDLWRRRGGGDDARAPSDPVGGLEVPGSWFRFGVLFCTAGILIVGHLAFAIAWPLLLMAVALSLVFVVVASRAAGETDIIPAGQLGKVAQLSFGGAAPGRLSTNLMATSVTTTSAASAADLGTNLKCGYLLGGNPRRQFLAQLLGVLVGTAVVVPAFAVLVPDASMLGSPRLPAPAAVAWRALAELMSTGMSALTSPARVALVIGLLLGVVFSLLGTRFPGRRWVPSAFGLGLGMVIAFSQSVTFVMGAVLALLVRRLDPGRAERYTVPAASGIIAGESLLGVLLATLAVLGLMPSD